VIFGTIESAIKNPKIISWAMENLSIPLDRARRVVLGTRIGALEYVHRRIAAGITLVVPYVLWYNTDIWDFHGYGRGYGKFDYTIR
jgi:hypothetical protein